MAYMWVTAPAESNYGLSFELHPLLHILFGLNSLDSRKNSATSGSISLSNMPLYGCRTSSTGWIVLCVTNGFHSFLRQHCLPGHQFKQGVIDFLG